MVAYQATVSADQDWKPARTVEFVVAAGAGGAADVTARVIQKILQDNQIVASPITIVNKPGGGTAMGWTYMSQKVGDGHYISIGGVPLLTGHILGTSALSYADFTSLATLYKEYSVFAVKADSKIASSADLLQALRAQSGLLSIGIATAYGNHIHIGVGLVAKAAGVDVRKLKVVVFKAGTESVSALLGGHVDVVSTGMSNIGPYLQAGTVRVIAISAPQRVSGAFAAVPTWREHGINAVTSNTRFIMGPRSMTPAQIAYWEDVFKRLAQRDEWKQDVAAHLFEVSYLGAEETRTGLAREYAEFKAVLSELGMVKR